MSQFRRKLLESYATNKLVYPGLIAAWSAKGKTNEDADRNVLKDLTGNGHDITLNGFAFSEMSGYGGYSTDFTKTSSTNKNESFDLITYNKIHYIKVINLTGDIWDIRFAKEEKVKFKVTGSNDKNLEFGSFDDKFYSVHDGYNEFNVTKTLGYLFKSNVSGECDITIELLPEYPDALVFDGVDDCGINKTVPDLQGDYTIIVKRKTLKHLLPLHSICATNGQFGEVAFTLSDTTVRDLNKNIVMASSYSYESYVPLQTGDIIFQTLDNYNGIPIKHGDIVPTIGFNISSYGALYWNGVFYSAYLFDRSLDDQEIKSFIRKHIDPEYLLPSGIPTPDVYYDFTNGDNSKGEANNVITDLSGNGNDATAHNFAWNEESGYAEGGGLKFDGVDDYITLNNTNNTKVYYRTVIGVVTVYKNKSTMLYDQRKFNIQTHNGALLYEGILYYSRNNINAKNCLTYINGELNKINVHSNNTVNKLHNFAVTFDDAEFDNIREQFITIGSTNGYGFNTNMNMYKFMAFKDRLTEEQIKAVINKYNLLDGVDNIDVN